MSIVIDGKGHVSGRLAGVIAKQLLNGRKIVVVRAESIVTTGDHRFNYHKYRRFLRKTTNSNPRHGPFHERAPAEIFSRTVRGMVNYKTARGAAAFARLKVYEGIPEKYEGVKKLVVPTALRVVAIRTDRPVTTLGKISTTFGWKYGHVVKALEEKRIAKAAELHEAKKAEKEKKQRAIAAANKQLGEAAVKFLETYVE
ncbi:Rpl16ap [Histomonas meleagridis]|uniref:Rpl16ap n=1 Tax=Histomonas meleagridis TaxID=135588 RepID=UPI0035595DAA|nr:Rpl16ap [Histomonas meleagridis]KAH0804608.1 Rpl16ap [Histomonas meleagridis]